MKQMWPEKHNGILNLQVIRDTGHRDHNETLFSTHLLRKKVQRVILLSAGQDVEQQAPLKLLIGV